MSLLLVLLGLGVVVAVGWVGRSARAMRRWRGVERLSGPGRRNAVAQVPVATWAPYADYAAARGDGDRAVQLLELRHAVERELIQARMAGDYSWRLYLFGGLCLAILVRPESQEVALWGCAVIGGGALLLVTFGQRVGVDAKRRAAAWKTFIQREGESLHNKER